jgi:hypothetical protein
MSGFIGPALPLHLQMKLESSGNQETSKSVECKMEQDRESDALVGPSLPPELINRMNSPSLFMPELTEKRNSKAPKIFPSLPTHLHIAHSDIKSPQENVGASIGPALPPHLKKGHKTENHNESQSRCTACVLPLPKAADEVDAISVPNLDADEEAYRHGPQDEMYGPALPPGLKVRSSSYTQDDEMAQGVLGPYLAPALKLSESVDQGSSDSDVDFVGPVPAPEVVSNAKYLQEQFDDRALRMKRKLAGKVM